MSTAHPSPNFATSIQSYFTCRYTSSSGADHTLDVNKVIGDCRQRQLVPMQEFSKIIGERTEKMQKRGAVCLRGRAPSDISTVIHILLRRLEDHAVRYVHAQDQRNALVRIACFHSPPAAASSRLHVVLSAG